MNEELLEIYFDWIFFMYIIFLYISIFLMLFVMIGDIGDLEEQLSANNFMESLEREVVKDEGFIKNKDIDKDYIFNNNLLIRGIDDLLIDRLESKDGSLKWSELNAIKAEAFRQNRIMKWEDMVDMTRVIPTNINIQIINN